MADSDPSPELQKVHDLKAVIASFDRSREEMIKRRNRATDSVMLVIDERLATNERALEALNRSLKFAEDDLRSHEEKQNGVRSYLLP